PAQAAIPAAPTSLSAVPNMGPITSPPPPAQAPGAPKTQPAAAPAPVAAAAPAPAQATPAPTHTPAFVTAPPPPPAAPSPPVVPYGSFIASHKIAGEEPHLPPSLRSALAETQALARVCIAADGHVDETRILRSPSAAADDAIRSALRGWKFR